MTTIDLSGTWRLHDAEGEYECDMPIPGDAHSALLAAGLIPDPYVGKNELAVRPLADRDWIATRTFQWDGDPSEGGWHLDIDYLDTVAEVRLNGHLAPRPYKTYAFADPHIAHSITENDGVLSLELSSKLPAYFVAIECDAEGHFSDLAFDLIPGETRSVTFRPHHTQDLGKAISSLRIRDLYAATCR